MKAEAKSIRFLKEVNFFRIPFFQRPYVWGEDNWKDLIDTLLEEKSTKFLGSIILKEGNSGEYEVIDGQQRLTTLSILLKAFYDACETDKKTLTSKFAEYFFNLNDDRNLIKIEHSIKDKNDYKNVIGEFYDGFISTCNVDFNTIIQDNFKCSPILKCYKYFFEIFKKSKQRREQLNLFLQSPVYILVKIELEKDDNAQQIFDIINYQGVRLTSSDFIKNALFQKMVELAGNDEKAKEEAEKFYDKEWSPVFLNNDVAKNFWLLVRDNENRKAKDNSEIFFHSFAVIFDFAEDEDIEKNDIITIYRDKIKNIGNIKECKYFLKQILEFACIYKTKFPFLYENTILRFTDYEKRLLHIMTFLKDYRFLPYVLFLYNFFKDDEENLKNNLFQVEQLLIRKYIQSPKSPNFIDSKNMNRGFIQSVKNGDNTSLKRYLIEYSNKKIEYELKKDFSSKYVAKVLCLVLFWIELYRRYIDQNDEGLSYFKIEEPYNLEHIIPQSWDTRPAWVNALVPKQFQIYNIGNNSKKHILDRPTIQIPNNIKNKINNKIWLLGNMTLLGKEDNKKVANQEYIKKSDTYRSYNLSITRDDLVLGDNYYEWNKEPLKALEKRNERLIKEFIEIWGDKSWIENQRKKAQHYYTTIKEGDILVDNYNEKMGSIYREFYKYNNIFLKIGLQIDDLEQKYDEVTSTVSNTILSSTLWSNYSLEEDIYTDYYGDNMQNVFDFFKASKSLHFSIKCNSNFKPLKDSEIHIYKVKNKYKDYTYQQFTDLRDQLNKYQANKIKETKDRIDKLADNFFIENSEVFEVKLKNKIPQDENGWIPLKNIASNFIFGYFYYKKGLDKLFEFEKFESNYIKENGIKVRTEYFTDVDCDGDEVGYNEKIYLIDGKEFTEEEFLDHIIPALEEKLAKDYMCKNIYKLDDEEKKWLDFLEYAYIMGDNINFYRYHCCSIPFINGSFQYKRENINFLDESGKKETNKAIIDEIETKLRALFNEPAWQDYKELVPEELKPDWMKPIKSKNKRNKKKLS